jgi:hypothetical protein
MIDKQNKNIEELSKFDPEGLGQLRPTRGSLYLKLALVAVLMLLSLGVGTLMSGRSESRRIALLEEENALLRAKIELYVSTVDSIYNMLDSLGMNHDPKRNPELYRGGAATGTEQSRDPKLKREMETLERDLVTILQILGPKMPEGPNPHNRMENPGGDVPSIYPTFGRISDGWGTRIHPITNNLEFHYGIDIANEIGTPIYATAAGVVARADYDRGYGKRIMLDHGNGYQTHYAHLYSSKVKEGDAVSKGQIIALMGNSGFSTGPHLHYEVMFNERKLNPTRYLNRIERYASR